MERMARTQTRDEGRKVGIEIARELCAIIHSRVSGFQVSASFGNVDIALEVLDKTPSP
jgi:hypothetical protein